MNLVSGAFLAFIAVAMAVYMLTPNRHKWKILLLFSLIFYASSGFDKLMFILGTSLVVYMCARRMQGIYQEYDTLCAERKPSISEKRALMQGYRKRCKRLLTAALLLCLGILAYCKFGNRVVGKVGALIGRQWSVGIIVPLGVSYYTFSSIGYLLDVYWRKTSAGQSYPRLLLCMVYFPHIIEGPISRYQTLLPQLDTLTNPDWNRLCMGLQLTLWGYFKKLVIADRLGFFVADVFGNIYKNIGLTFVVALVFGAFQIYADFSGCMDIIYGISEVFGIQLAKNFDHPFFSRSAAEFWRRWHITLGAWFKDYVYVPVTTSSAVRKIRRMVVKRCGEAASKVVMTIIPLGTVWLLTGIWHGTGMGYVVWGMYWGALLICSSLLEEPIAKLSNVLRINTKSREWTMWQRFRTFCLYVIGLLFILPNWIGNSVVVAQRIFMKFNPWIFWDQSLYTHGLDQRNFMVVILSILLLMYVDSLQERMNVREILSKQHIAVRWTVYLAGLFLVLILGIYGPGFEASAFIYEMY